MLLLLHERVESPLSIFILDSTMVTITILWLGTERKFCDLFKGAVDSNFNSLFPNQIFVAESMAESEIEEFSLLFCHTTTRLSIFMYLKSERF